MAIGTDRYASRADTLLFLACVGLSIAALSLPDQWRDPLAQGLRQSVLAPFLFLQRQTELLAAARYRYDAVVAQRDSVALAATFLPELRSENARLRSLLGLSARLGGGYVSAEILHQPEPTNPLSFVVSAGKKEGVRPLLAVVSPEGLVGLVASVDEHTSVVLSWAHPEFRASAIATDGSVVGIAAPHGAEGPGVWLLELQGVLYRQRVPVGTVIVTSGMGGVFPRGIPIGTVIDTAGEEKGWGRTYLVRPAIHPAELSHVMILTSPRTAGSDLRNAFTVPQDSAPPGAAPPQ
ncbi:MAG TPA: rod shape-determining protein MreC [Gemmatimonadales bacterium]|jgi:rod shape-determining protein MreC|nr:rod shape-determining protein MreC [Gemmatimonadales bacterium]